MLDHLHKQPSVGDDTTTARLAKCTASIWCRRWSDSVHTVNVAYVSARGCGANQPAERGTLRTNEWTILSLVLNWRLISHFSSLIRCSMEIDSHRLISHSRIQRLVCSLGSARRNVTGQSSPDDSKWWWPRMRNWEGAVSRDSLGLACNHHTCAVLTAWKCFSKSVPSHRRFRATMSYLLKQAVPRDNFLFGTHNARCSMRDKEEAKRAEQPCPGKSFPWCSMHLHNQWRTNGSGEGLPKPWTLARMSLSSLSLFLWAWARCSRQ